MSIQILACYSKAGSSWDAAIFSKCEKLELPYYTNIEEFHRLCPQIKDLDPDCDLQILYDEKGNWHVPSFIWGWEAKATDLHASLIGNDVSFEDEIIQHLVRNQSLTRYGAIVAGPQETHDIQMFTGMCSKHGVNWNWCSTIEKAVEKCFDLVEQADRVIDCRKPIYINKSADIPQFAAMIATFWKLTGDRALKIYDCLKERGYDTPAEMFANFAEAFSDNEDNLYRLWHDWYHGGIEPKKNLLRDPKVKKTQRKAD